ncbi:unnamed protein product, partial [Penicillium viridicatum]
MSDKGKKRAAEWCTFCDMGGHTRDECRVWAACVRDIGLANIAAMMAAYKPPPPKYEYSGCHFTHGLLTKAEGPRKCTNVVCLDKKKKPAAAGSKSTANADKKPAAHHDARLLALPPTTSAEGSGSAASTSSVS